MSSRRFTSGVRAAVTARKKPEALEYGPLRPGDHFSPVGHPSQKFRFISATLVDGKPSVINALGPLGDRQKLRSLRPETVKIPSTRALNKQRSMQ